MLPKVINSPAPYHHVQELAQLRPFDHPDASSTNPHLGLCPPFIMQIAIIWLAFKGQT